MEYLEPIASVKDQIVDQLGQWAREAEVVAAKGRDVLESYYHEIANSNVDVVVDDFKNLKLTPATVGLTVTSITVLFVVQRLLFSSAPKAPAAKKPKKKKISKAQKANKQIQAILDDVESNFIPDIDDYIVNYQKLSDEDVTYKYKYFEEMLLKELMKLDGIDVTGNEILRENRRKVIKFIQDHQKRLDRFKKEVGF